MKRATDFNKHFFFIVLVVSNMLFFAIIMIALYKLLCSIDITLLSSIDIVKKQRYHIYKYLSEFYISDSFFLYCSNIISASSSNMYVYISDLNNQTESINLLCSDIHYSVMYYSMFVDEILSSDWEISDEGHSLLYSKTLVVRFFSKAHEFGFLEFEFYCLQDKVIVFSNSTTLVFFRMINKLSYDVNCMVIFLISPANIIFEFNKLQCFCFEDLLVLDSEAIELPVIFRIQGTSLVFLASRPKVLFYYLLIGK